MDPYKTYYATFKDKHVDLYNMNKTLIRRFNVQSEVVNAQVNNAGDNTTVAIVMKNGKFCIYKSNGTLVRA